MGRGPVAWNAPGGTGLLPTLPLAEEAMKYERFHLVLMATHACNLGCDYCYTGRKFHRVMRSGGGPGAGDDRIAAYWSLMRPGYVAVEESEVAN